MFTPGLLVEHFFCAVEEERPLLRGDHLDLHAMLRRNLGEGLIGAEGLTIHHRVGHDDDGTSVAGQETAHLAQRSAHFFGPEVAGFVEAQPAVSAA